MFLEKTSHKKKIKHFDLQEYRKRYYKENKFVLWLLSKAYRLKNSWFPCMKINIDWKIRYLPFDNLEKPNSTTNNMNLYDEWKRKITEFEAIKSYYNNKTHKK